MKALIFVTETEPGVGVAIDAVVMVGNYYDDGDLVRDVRAALAGVDRSNSTACNIAVRDYMERYGADGVGFKLVDARELYREDAHQ